MLDINGINDYKEERSCSYKNEEYLVRDNGAVMRMSRQNKKERLNDNKWTFGRKNGNNGYCFFFGSNHRIHQIVATAFHGIPPTEEHIVDHIDTNRQNNRPNNLRWVTRLEHVLLNETTRKRIEYKTGVSIYEFLANPSRYREALGDPDISWMRRVSDEEARECSKNLRRWCKSEPKNNPSGQKIGEWIYRFPHTSHSNSVNYFIPMVGQQNWKTPTSFVCCPEVIEGNPMKCYMDRLFKNAVFTRNRYGESIAVEYALVENQFILVRTEIASSVKPFGLVKITYENGHYLHTSMGTFFTETGAKKQFALAQGLEWSGGDSIDDYC